jgi:membrane protein implicated in regulation of membrane protease activity
MIETDRFIPQGAASRRRVPGLLTPVMWLCGLIATLAAMAIGAILAVFTAVAVAVIAVFGAILIFFAGLALRARRRFTGRNRRGDDVIEARKVDGEWVAYGWERQGR